MQGCTEAQSQITRTVKVVTLGDVGAGKTTLCKAMCSKDENVDTTPTLGIDFWTKVLHHSNNRVRINVYDTSGQERFQALTPSYLRTADIILIVLSAVTTDDVMSDCLDKWHAIAQNGARRQTKFVVAVTKRDLVNGTFIVGAKTSNKLVKCGLKRYHVVTGTHGPSGAGVHDLWDDIAQCAIECCNERQPPLSRAALAVDARQPNLTSKPQAPTTCFDKVSRCC